MLSPYGMEIVESCLTCKLRADRIFCDLPATALRSLKTSSTRPRTPRGQCYLSKDRCHAASLCSAKAL